MEKRRVRFSRLESAENFAKKVNGRINDLRNQKGVKSKFTVTFFVEKDYNDSDDWAPEEDRDFGYPNSFWKD